MDIPTERSSTALLALLAQAVTQTQQRALPTVATPDLVQPSWFFLSDDAAFTRFNQLGRAVRISKFISQE